MPRPQRAIVPGYPHHVIQRGNDRQPVFRSRDDFIVYREFLHECAERYSVAIHAYVLMTNHVHILATPERSSDLSNQMQSFGPKYVYYFNKRYERTGALWEGRFKSCVVDTDGYFLSCSRYIELNPVRAEMVSGPAAYEFSSFPHNALGRSDPLVKKHPVFLALGKNDSARRRAYCSLFKNNEDPDVLASIRVATQRCETLGNDAFRNRVESITGIRRRHAAPGRPISRRPGNQATRK